MPRTSPDRSRLLRLRTAAVLRLREARSYVDDLARPPVTGRAKPLLIFAQGRAGTTLLESLLVSTGHYEGHHEVLNTVTREVLWPVRHVRGLARGRAPRHVVAHIKPVHLVQDRRRPVDMAAFLRAVHDDGWTVLHLERTDVLRQTLSLFIAEGRGSFHKTDAAEERRQLHIPPEDFLRQVQGRTIMLQQERAALAALPHLRVSYEDDLLPPDRHQPTVDRILAHVGLAPRPVSTQLRKIAGGAVADGIGNLSELRAYLAAHGIAWPT